MILVMCWLVLTPKISDYFKYLNNNNLKKNYLLRFSKSSV